MRAGDDRGALPSHHRAHIHERQEGAAEANGHGAPGHARPRASRTRLHALYSFSALQSRTFLGSTKGLVSCTLRTLHTGSCAKICVLTVALIPVLGGHAPSQWVTCGGAAARRLFALAPVPFEQLGASPKCTQNQLSKSCRCRVGKQRMPTCPS